MTDHMAIKAHRNDTVFSHRIDWHPRGRDQKMIILATTDITGRAAIESADFQLPARRDDLCAQVIAIIAAAVAIH